MAQARDPVPQTNQSAAARRAAGGKVCWIQTDFQYQAESWSNWFSKRLRSDASAAMISALSPGHHGFEMFGEMDVQPSDWRCIKTRFSPFARDASMLEQQLSAHAIDTVIVTGTVSNTCCESTARDAMMLNYRVIFVSDSNATRTDAEHNATLGNMLQTFADVARSTDIIALLKSKSATRRGQP
ncbi:MAG: isochorismatase family protein [Pseudolabrys sp.]